MKKFNLEEAKAGKPVCTRDGRKARIICFDAKNDNYPILALLETKDREQAYWYTANGYGSLDRSEKSFDLMMASEHHEGRVNVYKVGNINYHYIASSVIYNSREEAALVKNTDTSYITTIKIKWED